MLSQSQPAIRCEGLTKQYGEVHALTDLNLSVPQGIIFGFLGRNGAGKTTTMRLLTGLAHPTSGHAWINGVETTNGHDLSHRQYGYLPQTASFYGWMTAQEYLSYVLGLFEVPVGEHKNRIAECLQQVGLQKAARRQISGFSGGMLQRLGIAQALIHRPPVLLLDEPTSSLDPAGRYEVLELLSALRGQTTIFLSSHILADVERISDWVGVIHEGVLLFETSQAELISRYQANVVLLEVDNAKPEALDGFLKKIRLLPWVETVNVETSSVRITVNDIPAAKQAVLPLVVEHGLVLERMQWVRPTLEEIFLQVSSTGGD